MQNAIEEFKNSNLKKLAVVVQTTYSLEKFLELTTIIKENLATQKENIEITNTICNATKSRQEETDKISKQVEYMIIIGGKNSSNTKKLYEIASKNCKNTICIEDKKELNIEEISDKKLVGIMAGASTPQDSIDEVVEMLKNT